MIFFLGENRILKFFQWMNEAMKIKWSSISFLLLLFSKSKVKHIVKLSGWLACWLSSSRVACRIEAGKEGMLLKIWMHLLFFGWRDTVKFCAICSLLLTGFIWNLWWIWLSEWREEIFYFYIRSLQHTHSTHTMHCFCLSLSSLAFNFYLLEKMRQGKKG